MPAGTRLRTVSDAACDTQAQTSQATMTCDVHIRARQHEKMATLSASVKAV